MSGKRSIRTKVQPKKKITHKMGFSLIELLVVISIMGVVGVVSIASFVSFNGSQTVESAASDVANAYILARQRSLSQIKPTQCTSTQSLRGYQIVLSTTARTYRLNALCGTATYQIFQKTLPPQVTFASTSPTTVTFSVPNATTTGQATVTINGYGKTKSITIAQSGTISTQ